MNTEQRNLVTAFKNKFNINTNTSDITFNKVSVEPYKSLENDHRFGEQESLLYDIDFLVFNVHITLRVLAFVYEHNAEILKLEINVDQDLLKAEIASCRNFLQRKRNLNLTFEVLIKACKYHEIRRLICQTVFQKQTNRITISTYGGVMVIRFKDHDGNKDILELVWTLSWNADDCEIRDHIEVYFHESSLGIESRDKVKYLLNYLIETDLDFHAKLKTCRRLMLHLYGSNLDVLEISDSDDDIVEISEPDDDDILLIE